ncbi:MAG: MerR family transcriptional regulator [Gammaproteobacteria bacterium]|nr:MerR family transcriptional regulator [Gammaproteobacteria bacterium]
MKIGELADQIGIAASTIRYYEQVGLIDPPERIGGQRRFPKSAVQALRFIQLAQAGGFTIAEIKTILDGYPNTTLGEQWHKLAERKKLEIGRKIRELQRVDSVLDALLTCECTTINECVERASVEL